MCHHQLVALNQLMPILSRLPPRPSSVKMLFFLSNAILIYHSVTQTRLHIKASYIGFLKELSKVCAQRGAGSLMLGPDKFNSGQWSAILGEHN